jgi:hypothetical protein
MKTAESVKGTLNLLRSALRAEETCNLSRHECCCSGYDMMQDTGMPCQQGCRKTDCREENMGEPEWTNVMILQDDFCSATIISLFQSDAP